MNKKITLDMVGDPKCLFSKCLPEILNDVLERGDDNWTSCRAASNPNCPAKSLKMVLGRGNYDRVAQCAASNPNCPPEALKMVVERGKDDWVSRDAARNPNCPSEALQMILERGENNGVSRSAAENRNCPPQVRLKWLWAVGRIKMPDLLKHDVQVIKNYNRPDEAWEQFKRMVK